MVDDEVERTRTRKQKLKSKLKFLENIIELRN